MTVPSQQLLWTIACLFGSLTVGTLVRISMLRGVPNESAQSTLKSMWTWWALALLLAIAVIFGNLGVVVLLAIAGILSLREHLQMIGWKSIGTPTAVLVFAFVPFYYVLVILGYDEILRSAAPVAFILVLGGCRAWFGLIEEFIRITAACIWGLMLFVYCLSHACFLLNPPVFAEPWVGNIGWFLFLVLLTESNDIAQALVGRRFGKTKITPRISPNKSLEGLLGGIAVSMMLAVILAPWLTTMMQPTRMQPRSWCAGAFLAMLSGLLIAIFGFFGDINKSGIKRDVGVKDSGTMLPGQGGIMDRIDSLTFSAPAFYYFVQFLQKVV